ncbi:MAG: outer membrane protein transport protein [Deltaproteobacteria bacterium]|nr:outer membrane protein transport protein [Deltaproteobacteria bacterium]
MKRVFSAAAAVACMLGFAAQALSGGFALEEQSVSGLGNAYAGGAAVVEDASTIFFNPAGLTRLKGQNAAAGVHLIVPHARFEKDLALDAAGAPLTGGEGGDAAESRLVPNAYYGVTLGSGLALGLGVSVPFGLSTEYPKDWVGRYQAVRSEVAVLNLNSSAAYRLTKRWSVGAGFNAQRLEAEMTNRVDFGAILAPTLGTLPQSADGTSKLTGTNWSYGWNVGALYELGDDTRIGLAYRSRVKHDIEGEAEFDLPPGLPAPAADALAAQGFRNDDAKVSITLPDSASLSLFHRLNRHWAAMVDLTWTNWSTFDELRVRFKSGLPDDVTEEQWEDTWRLALGLTYTPSSVWTWRAGVAYDQDPIPDARHRTPRIPSADRIWTAFGLGYRPAPWLGFDLGYAHLFVADAKIDRQVATEQDALKGALRGSYELSADIVSAQLTASF